LRAMSAERYRWARSKMPLIQLLARALVTAFVSLANETDLDG
jgi:hypothetical protein